MNDIQKIRQLWHYLELTDDEMLIIPAYNTDLNKDEYLVITMPEQTMNIVVAGEKPDFNLLHAFHYISQRDARGRYRIPSVTQMERDKKMDY